MLKKNISFQDEKLSLKEKVKKLLALRFIFSIKKKKITFKTSEYNRTDGMDWASFSSCGYLENAENSLGVLWEASLRPHLATSFTLVWCPWGASPTCMMEITSFSLLMVSEFDTCTKNSLQSLFCDTRDGGFHIDAS